MKPSFSMGVAWFFASALTAQVSVPSLDPQALEGVFKGGKTILVEFGGPSCVPCKKMQPVLAALQQELGGKGGVFNLYITEYPEVAKRYRVMVMPTQVVFDSKGREILRHQGYWELDAIRAALKAKGLL